MKKKAFLVIVACLLVFVFSSCATNVGPNWQNVWFVAQIDPARHDYTILGHVSIERGWIGVLGFSLPFLGNLFLFETGGVTHADMLSEARRVHPNSNAVLNIQVSSRQSRVLPPIFARRVFTVTGLAVQFSEEQLNSGIHSNRF